VSILEPRVIVPDQSLSGDYASLSLWPCNPSLGEDSDDDDLGMNHMETIPTAVSAKSFGNESSSIVQLFRSSRQTVPHLS
jgi:hypothetical protein